MVGLASFISPLKRFALLDADSGFQTQIRVDDFGIGCLSGRGGFVGGLAFLFCASV
jgi:hypothetical protein